MNQTNAQEAIDLTYLRQMAGEDKNFYREMIEVCLSTIPTKLKALGTAISENDWKQVAMVAHGLKSTVRMTGTDICPILEKMETDSRYRRKLGEIPLAFSEVEALLTLAQSELSSELALL